MQIVKIQTNDRLEVMELPRYEARHVREIRSFVATCLEKWGFSDEVVYNAQVAASELATNALRHGNASGARVWAAVGRTFDGLPLIEMYDPAGTVPPEASAPGRELQESNRGLALVVRNLCRAWGWVRAPDGTGKIVYVILKAGFPSEN